MKHIMLTVWKSVKSELYVQVPDNFDIHDARLVAQLDLAEGCMETLCEGDWTPELDADYEVSDIRNVTDDEAEKYTVWKPVVEPPL